MVNRLVNWMVESRKIVDEVTGLWSTRRVDEVMRCYGFDGNSWGRKRLFVDQIFLLLWKLVIFGHYK